MEKTRKASVKANDTILAAITSFWQACLELTNPMTNESNTTKVEAIVDVGTADEQNICPKCRQYG
jgi:hypothetical protein